MDGVRPGEEGELGGPAASSVLLVQSAGENV